MKNKSKSAFAVILYIFGIIFLIVTAFMLFAAISYSRVYLQSYEATFMDMKSHILQYVITNVAPYLGIGIICLGLGRTIALYSRTDIDEDVENEADERVLEEIEKLSQTVEILRENVDYLAEDIDATREVISIKIEEKEKRDSYRLTKMGEDLEATMKALEVDRVATEEEIPCQAEIRVPEIMSGAETMSIPEIPQVESKSMQYPQIFTVTRRMTMPAVR